MRGKRLLPALVFLGGLAALLPRASPGLYWGEGPLLALAGQSLGISHPPGYPLHSLLTRGLQFLPLGDPAWRAGLLALLAGAAAAALAYLVVLKATASQAAGLIAVLAYLNAEPLVSSALSAEVYSLNLVFVLACLGLALAPFGRLPEGRRLPLTAFAFGLGLGNHLTLLLLGPVLLLALAAGPGRRPPARILSLAIGLGLLGLGVLLYDPLRSAWGSGLDWDAPRWARQLAVLAMAAEEALPSAAAGLASPADWLAALGRTLIRLPQAAGWLPTGLAGIGCLASLAPGRRAGLAAPLGILLLAGTVSGYYTMETDYFLTPAFALLAVAAGLGAAALLRAAGRRGRWRRLAAAGLLAAAGIAALANLGRLDRSRLHAPREYGVRLLASLPPDSIVITRRSDLAFLLWYLQAIERRSPDALIVFRHLLAFPWYYRQLTEQCPSCRWARPDPALFEDSQAWVQFMVEVLVDRHQGQRPVFLAEPDDFFGFLAAGHPEWFIHPWGFVHRISLDRAGPALAGIPAAPAGPFDRLTHDILARNYYEIGRVRAARPGTEGR